MKKGGKEMVYIYLDDLRTIDQKVVDSYPNSIFLYPKTYKEAIHALESSIEKGQNILIDFDHDLGEKKTGYDVAKWVVESGYENIEFLVHSANPVGKKNIIELLTHYGYKYYGRW